MVRLLNQYQLLWSRLKNNAIEADNATKALNINQAKLRVLLSRMRKEHMAVTTGRGEYRLVEPRKWIQIKGLAWRNLPIPDQLIDDLVLHSEEIRAIVLYGSTVSGNTTPLSDVDILIISDKNLTELEDKYKFPISIEVQPTEGYDRIYVHNAIKKGEAIYDDDVLDRMGNFKTTKEDYAKKLEEIRSSLFKLNDERLFESLTIMDVAHILYSSLRGLEIGEEEICGKISEIGEINQGILKGAKELYGLSKAGQRGVPEVTRNDLKALRDAIIGKWVNLKIEVDRWAEKRR
jgi:predicted nucleotidyltransferase